MQGPSVVSAELGHAEHLGVDIGGDDLNFVLVDEFPMFKQVERDRVRLLPGRAWHRPDADHPPSCRRLHNRRQQRIDQTFELINFAIEIGLVDRHRVDERLILGVVRPRANCVEVPVKRPAPGSDDPILEPPVNEIAFVGAKLDSGLAIEKAGESLKVAVADDGRRLLFGRGCHSGLSDPVDSRSRRKSEKGLFGKAVRDRTNLWDHLRRSGRSDHVKGRRADIDVGVG